MCMLVSSQLAPLELTCALLVRICWSCWRLLVVNKGSSPPMDFCLWELDFAPYPMALPSHPTSPRFPVVYLHRRVCQFCQCWTRAAAHRHLHLGAFLLAVSWLPLSPVFNV